MGVRSPEFQGDKITPVLSSNHLPGVSKLSLNGFEATMMPFNVPLAVIYEMEHGVGTITIE